MGQVYLRALGECAIETAGFRIGPASKYVFALGLYFALERGKRIPRQLLVDLLWPDVKNEGHAKHRFRQTLLRLRQLGVPAISEQGHVRLERDSVHADFDLLLSFTGEAEEVVRSRDSFEFLRGFQPRVSEQYAAWLDLHRSRVELAVQRLFVYALKSARTRGDWPTVEELALTCLRIDPLNEEATMARAEATAMRGSKAQAIRILDSYMDALGDKALAIGLPARVLRCRIAERLTERRYTALTDEHFVGREDETTAFSQMLDDAKRRHGSATLVLGAAGIGKTRLLKEVSQMAVLKGATLVSLQCQATSADRPIGLLADLTASLRTLPGSIGASVESLALLQRLTEYMAPFPTDSDVGDAGGSGAAVRRAVFDLFDAVVDEGLLFITVEDVHWVDAFSWRILQTLAGLVARRTAIILATARHDAWSTARDDPKYSDPFHIRRLPPLTQVAAGSLVEKLLADYGSEVPAEMLMWCVSVAEGNPYYLRELVTRWLETHEPFGVPQSLAELVDRRLGRLTPEALRVFQACVALGGLCTVARLEGIAATEPAQLAKTLDELSSAGLITSSGISIAPKHDLLAQAARDRLAPPLRVLIHQRIAGILENEARDEPEPATLWECAHHWQSAGNPDRAVTFLDDCGRHLMGIGLPDEASDVYRRALEFETADFARELTLRTGLVSALKQRGLLEQCITEIANLRAAARRAGYPLEAHSALELIEIEVRWRADGASVEALNAVLSCVQAHDASPSHRLRAAYWALALAQNLGMSDAAKQAWACVEPFVRHAHSDPIACLQLGMAYHADYGDLEQAATFARQFVSAEQASGGAARVVRAMRNAAMTLRRAGYMDEARTMVVEAFDISTRNHAALAAFDAAQQAISGALQEGDLDAAHRWEQLAQEWAAKCEGRFPHEDLTITSGCLALAGNNLARVRELVGRLPNWRSDSHVRRRQLVVSLLLALQTRTTGSRIDPDLLQQCEATFAQARSWGHQDFSAECLANAYMALGQTDRAIELLADYLRNHRRDKGPLLKSLTESLPMIALRDRQRTATLPLEPRSPDYNASIPDSTQLLAALQRA